MTTTGIGESTMRRRWLEKTRCGHGDLKYSEEFKEIITNTKKQRNNDERTVMSINLKKKE